MNEENSILDKIINSQQMQEKMKFNPAETVSILLKFLSSKEEDIVRRRFGLGSEVKETLEQIGRFYKVTRERVRQIESTSVVKIKSHKNFNELMRPLEHFLTTVAVRYGGIVAEPLLLKDAFDLKEEIDRQYHYLEFILIKLLDKQFILIPEGSIMRKSWRLKATSLDLLEHTIKELVKIIEDQKQPIALDVLLQQFKKSELYQKHQVFFTDDVIYSYLECSSQIAKNPFGEYGLIGWGLIKPKRINDKIYLVLQKKGSPMHFTEIAKEINRIGFDQRKAYPPTIHNELILNDHYVLVGRGIYALREWGYKPGVVADVLVDILKNGGKPMTRQELVSSVLKQRVVKKNTIHLALSDRSKFKKLADGQYVLVTA